MAKAKTIAAAISALQDAMYEAQKGDKEISNGDMELLVNLATDIVNKDYWADVRGIGGEILRKIKDGEIKDEDDLQRQLSEDVDGSQRVIYTIQARLGMLATNSADAWEDVGMENPTIEQQMYAALEADVNNWLHSNDVEELLEAAQGG